ncbi:MAG: low molecular weight protein-tyrosine-phosphatase [Bacteroidia bacterium]|nr:low molecular weight protein-tyrosine-phosphatase [Bacteroidia bacterium]
MTSVLFVCLGNICRSPLAEGLFVHQVAKAGLSHQFSADSAGTGDWHAGELPDPRSRAVAAKHGVLLPSLARQITPRDLVSHGYILCMDRQNLANVAALGPVQGELLLLGQFDPQGVHEVPDPYWGTDADFEAVFQQISRSTSAFLAHLTGAR